RRRTAARCRPGAGRSRRARGARGRLARARRGSGRSVRRAGHAAVGAVSESIRVLIVDDDALVRSGLQLMLAGAAGIDVVGEVADGRGVLAAIDRYHTDVVLMDIRMPQLD